MIKTNNKQTWKRIAIVSTILFLLVLSNMVFNVIVEKKQQQELKLNQTIQSAFNNGTQYGQLALVASINQVNEFPFIVNIENKTTIDSVSICSQEFYNYLNKVCG